MRVAPAVVALGGMMVGSLLTVVVARTTAVGPSPDVDVVDVTPDTIVVDGVALVHRDYGPIVTIPTRCVIKPHYPVEQRVICLLRHIPELTGNE